MKILVVEDDPMTLILVSRMLEKTGYQVVKATDGQQAWEIIQKETFPMVITDWMMPNLDGIELCSRIKSHQKQGFYTYIILLSAKSEVENLRDGLAAGADDFIGKPCEKEELIARVRAAQRILKLESQLAERITQLEGANLLIAKSNERMKQDLVAAARLQVSLLPTKAPIIPEARFAWTYRPLDELAGDCLHVFPLDEEHMGFYVLDVSGHGTPAALLSVTLSHSLAPGTDGGLLVEDGKVVSPPEVLARLNRKFPIDLENPQYFTIFYGTLNRRTLELNYSIAAHPQLAYISSSKPPEFLPGTGYPIGMLEDAEFENITLQLSKGDRLYIYTDGLTDAINKAGESFRVVLLENLSKLSGVALDESLKQLMTTCENWSIGVGLLDDISILAIEII